MPAANEVHEAIEEGVTAIFQAGPTRVITDDKGNVTGVEFIRMRPGEPDASGRRRPEPAPGTEFTIPCDRVLLAIGQGPELDWIGPGSERRRGDEATPPQGRRGDVRDRPARRLRHRRRPDRRGDGRPGDRRGPPRRLRRRRLPARASTSPAIKTRQKLAEPQPEFLSIVPFTSERRSRATGSRRWSRRSATGATSSTRSRTRREEAVAESTRCLQCTCEAIGFCDLRRLGIEYGTTLQTLEPQHHQGAGYRSVTENRFTGVNHDYIRDDSPRLHPARAVALHRLRPLRPGLRRGRRRGLLRLHADRLRHARDDAARHEPQRHAVRVLRPLRRDLPDRRAHAQAARPPEVRGRREPLHPVRHLRRRLPVRRAPRRRATSSSPTPRGPSR